MYLYLAPPHASWKLREAQRQQGSECHRRLQLAEGELAVLRKKLEEAEREKAHMHGPVDVRL